MLTKKLYEQATGRSQKSNIIAYQIRQSFRPGEITAEEANRIGYELASRFLKGKHAFIVATHTDREHIHNHIIYNSTTLDGTRKFRDFFFSGLAVQRLSDLICLEHQLSVIEKKPYRERQKRITYPPTESNRDRLCSVIDEILQQKPTDYEDFLQKLEQQGYEIKRGKSAQRRCPLLHIKTTAFIHNRSYNLMIDKFSQVAENLPAADRDADRQYHVINGYPVVFSFSKEPNPEAFERIRNILLATSYTKKVG